MDSGGESLGKNDDGGGIWKCESCTLDNPMSAPTCEVCGGPGVITDSNSLMEEGEVSQSPSTNSSKRFKGLSGSLTLTPVLRTSEQAES